MPPGSRPPAASAADGSVTIEAPSPEAIVAQVDGLARVVRTDTARGPLVWRIWGSGRPLLLLHGGKGSWTHWFANVRALAARYSVVVPDMPGFGDSAPLRPDSTAEAADLLADGLRTLALGRFVMAGFSYGTLLGARLLDSHAAACDGFVLVGSYALGPKNHQQSAMRKWRSLGDASERRAAHAHNLKTLMIHRRALVDDIAVHIQLQNAERAVTRLEKPEDSAFLADALRRWTPKVAAVWGEEDAVVKGHLPRHAASLRDIRPEARIEIVSNAGHWVQYEAADAINGLLLRTDPTATA